MTDRLQIRMLTDLDEIDGRQWDHLLEKTPCHRAFSSWTWFWAACLTDPHEGLRVFTAHRGDQLVGILPLVIRGGRLQFASTLADYHDLIAEPHDDAVLRSLLFRALDESQNHTEFFLSRIRPSSNLFKAFRLTALDFSEEHFEHVMDCAHIEWHPDLETYLAGKGKKFRKSLIYDIRRAARDGLLAREVRPSELDPQKLPAYFLKFHLERLSDDSVFLQPFAEQFVKKALPLLFEGRRARVFAAFHHDELKGLEIFMTGANSLGIWNGGFLAEIARWSPGKLMVAEAVRTTFHENIGRVDLLRGLYDWKKRWATGYHKVGSWSVKASPKSFPNWTPSND